MRAGEFRWAEVRVGLFVALGGLMLLGAIVYVGLSGSLFSSRRRLVAPFEDASGLAQGSPVQMGGVQVGEVLRVNLPDVATGRVRVELGVSPEALERLGPSSVASVDSQALVGQRFVSLTTRKPDEPSLKEGDSLTTQPSRDFGALFDEARVSMTKLNVLLDDAHDALAPLVRAAKALDDPDGTVGRLLHDGELYEQLSGAAAALQAIGERVAGGQGTLGALVQDEQLAGEVRQGLRSLAKTARGIGAGRGVLGRLAVENEDARRLDQTLKNLAAVSEDLASARGTLGGLIKDPALLAKLNQLVGDMDSLVADVRRNPGKYLKFQAF